MHLSGIRIVQVGPFDDVNFPFCDSDGRARLVTVVQGGGGVGKTTLLSAISATRPGHTVTPPTPLRDVIFESSAIGIEPVTAPQVVCDWELGEDDPGRAHLLRVGSPNVRVFADDEKESLRRREQNLFDKLSRNAGFAFLFIPSNRWFSRQPIVITSPSRSIARHDVRAGMSADEASRSDLARETKQALAYAEIASGLERVRGDANRFELLGDAMRFAVDQLASLCQLSYRGLDPASFEPVFILKGGRALSFDALPTRARHLVAFAALSVRVLWAAYPGQDPRSAEGVVAIDEICLYQDLSVQKELVWALRRALPRVQWILTTTSPAVGNSCDTQEVLALRRLPESFRVELFTGSEARTH